MADFSNNDLPKKNPDNGLETNDILEKIAPDRRSFVQKLLGMTSFAAPSVRTFLMGSAVVAMVPDVYASGNACVAGTDISNGLQNPQFLGNVGAPPLSWITDGSPAPGFASYIPGPAQYPAPQFPYAAYSPTIFGGSGVIRQLSSLTWAGGVTYTLRLYTGLPLKEPDNTTPVVGWPQDPHGVSRIYLTFGPGFGQVAAFDIPAPPPGTFAPYDITFTLPANSPAVGQKLGIMIFVSAPSGYSANFVITNCAV